MNIFEKYIHKATEETVSNMLGYLSVRHARPFKIKPPNPKIWPPHNEWLVLSAEGLQVCTFSSRECAEEFLSLVEELDRQLAQAIKETS